MCSRLFRETDSLSGIAMKPSCTASISDPLLTTFSAAYLGNAKCFSIALASTAGTGSSCMYVFSLDHSKGLPVFMNCKQNHHLSFPVC